MENSLEKITHGKYLINDKEFKEQVLVRDVTDDEEGDALDVMAVVRGKREQEDSKKRIAQILDDVFAEVHDWTCNQLPKQTQIQEEEMKVKISEWQKPADELDSDVVKAILIKLKNEDDEMKQMVTSNWQMKLHGIMRIDMAETKAFIEKCPFKKYKEFEKFLPNLVNKWAEELIKNLINHKGKLAAECADPEDFVKFFTQQSELDNSFEA